MNAGTAPSLTQNVAPLDAGAHVTAIGWLKGTAAFGLGDGGVSAGEGRREPSRRGASGCGRARGGKRRRALRHRRRRRTGGRDERGRLHQDPRRDQGRLDRFARLERRRRLRLRDRQAGDRPRRQGPGEDPRGPLRRPWACLRAQGLPAGDLPLQRRDPVVSQRGGQAGIPRMEGLASRRHLVAGCPLRRDLHAGERAPRLAARSRQGPYAHERLPVEDALPLLVRRTASGSPPPAPRRPSSGPSNPRKARWARRRANAASGPPRSAGSPSIPTPMCWPSATRTAASCSIRLNDASELLVRPAVEDGGITAMAWDKGGKRLAFGCEDGQAGILTLPA